jgi:hypothetical protein
MGHESKVYFWIAISRLPGNPQFYPLDKILLSLVKQPLLGKCGRCRCGAGAPARVG